MRNMFVFFEQQCIDLFLQKDVNRNKEEKNMTVKECYEQMGADYEGVLGRLRSEGLIKKFAKKFLDDGSFQSLNHSQMRS